MLNENDKQQNLSYSVKRNEDYIHVEAVLKSPLFSAHEEFNDAKIGLKVMKENFPNKIIAGYLNINSFRSKFEALQYVIDRNLDTNLLLETKLDDSFPSASDDKLLDKLCRVFNNFFLKTIDELKILNISNYKLDSTNK